MSAAWDLIRSKLPKGEFGRNVLVLFGGTTLAQAITILSAPILTRLDVPVAFGAYALFLAISTILVSLASAEYELGHKASSGSDFAVLSGWLILVRGLMSDHVQHQRACDG